MKTLKRIWGFFFRWQYVGTVVYVYEGINITSSVYRNRWTDSYHSFQG